MTMKQVYIFIMFTLIGVNIMCFGKSTTKVRHYKGHHEIGIRSKNVIAEKELAGCIIYIIDRNSCEVTTCDVIRFDKKTKRKYYICMGSSANGQFAYFKGKSIIVPEVKVINMNSATCAADYIYASRKVYYNFKGVKIGATPWM